MISETKLNLQKKIMTSVNYLLSQKQSIPVFTESKGLNDINDVAKEMISMEGNAYFLYTKDSNKDEYSIKKITKDRALMILITPLQRMSKERLLEEVGYWKECAGFFKEEENEKKLFSIDNLLANVSLR